MFFMSDTSITLAEILKKNGYKTAAFIGGFPLDSKFRADQGFDVYDDDFSNSAHYFDPHLPYTPSSPYDEEFELPYDGEVAYTDRQVGELLAKLGELGLKDNTLVVLTGDHGESLGTHNEVTHGEFVFDTTVMIPLIMSHGKRIPKGRRISTMVRSVDIMPTVLDFLNIPGSPHTQGRSLLPALEGKLEEEPALLEATLHYYEAHNLGHDPMMITGLRTSRWKLMHVAIERDGTPGWVGELYDLANEPLEMKNVSKENPEIFENLIEELHSMTRTYSEGALPGSNRMEMDDETRAKLKALGYLGK
jgi:arylsulfatase A-like enzyme